MPQRTIITDVSDIKNIARDINIFSCRKQIFKVQLTQFSNTENQEVEKTVVRYYSFGQHGFWNALPGYTLLMYLVMIVANIIPIDSIGLVPIILLYVPFSFGSFFILRILIAWYAKRSLIKLANDIESRNHTYSFVLHTQRKVMNLQ